MASRPAVDLGAGRLRRVRSRASTPSRSRPRSSPAACSCSRPTSAFPQNAQTPIAADIDFYQPEADGPLAASLDWRRSEGEEWTITVETSDGIERAPRGRRRAAAPQRRSAARTTGIGEYPDIYRTFVDLIDERRSLVDVAPLRLVADCLLVGSRTDRRTRPRLMEQLAPAGIMLIEAALVTSIRGGTSGNLDVAQVTTDELTQADEAFAGNRLLSTFSREARALIEPFGDDGRARSRRRCPQARRAGSIEPVSRSVRR